MYIVRYADDFRIFCRTKTDTERVKLAVAQKIQERLKLEISEEKTKVFNAIVSASKTCFLYDATYTYLCHSHAILFCFSSLVQITLFIPLLSRQRQNLSLHSPAVNHAPAPQPSVYRILHL